MSARYDLTGLQRTYLDTVRERITPDDNEPERVGELDDEGAVRLVPARWTEQVARIIAQDIWDSRVEPTGDVT